MKKPLIAIIVLILLVVGAWKAYQSITNRNRTEIGPEQASAIARIDRIESRVSASGVVEPVTREVLKAKSTDTVDKVIAKENSVVKKGAEIITFKNRSKAVKTPYDGVVSRIFVSEGDVVNKGQPLVDFFDNRNLLTRIMIDELDLPSIKVGQKATIVVKAFPDRVFTGKVSEIGQEGKTANGVSNFPVTVRFEETDGIRVGMTTEVTIVTAVKEEALVVPIEAVSIVDGEKTIVVERPNGTAETRVVETGIYSNIMVEIVDGLKEGEVVRLPQTTNNLYQQLIPEGFPVQGDNPDEVPETVEEEEQL